MRQGLIAIALAVAAGSFGWWKAGGEPQEAPAPETAPTQAEAAPQPLRDHVIAFSTDDAAMNAAAAKGRATLPRFRELIAAHLPGTYSVKFPLVQDGATELVWMQVTDAPEGRFVGVVASTLVNGNRYRIGDPITVSEAEVEDWMVLTDSEIYGGYTARASLKDLPKEEADRYAPMFRD